LSIRGVGDDRSNACFSSDAGATAKWTNTPAFVMAKRAYGARRHALLPSFRSRSVARLGSVLEECCRAAARAV
jgi:hypothetical protein